MNNWLVWSLLSAIFAGATAVLAKIGVTGVDSNFATAIRTTVILIFTWMVASFTRSYWSFGTISFRTWLFLGLSGLATGLSWLCYFRVLHLSNVFCAMRGDVERPDQFSVLPFELSALDCAVRHFG